MESKFFTPGQIGPLTLRNRSIRAAAFEGMSNEHKVSESLIAYHTNLAKGGVALTTVAYAAVNKGGLSFPHQLLMSENNISDLKRLTGSVHSHGALASIQIGHCGNMSNRKVSGLRALSPSGGINWYGPVITQKINHKEINQLIEDFKTAVRIADQSGFDAIEVHAGHGYLISQFLSPYTNSRRDNYGGSFENRSRLMCEVLGAVKDVLPSHMALIVKMNCSDGFKGGIGMEEGIKISKLVAACGAHAVIVSGGFVSRSPMYILRGEMPVDIMAYFIREKWKKFFVSLIGDKLIPSVPFKEGYFMDESDLIRKSIHIPVIVVGGMNSMGTIENAMQRGFEFIAMARALIRNTNFINELKNETANHSDCSICNYCVAKIYTGTMECHMNQSDLSEILKKKLERLAYV